MSQLKFVAVFAFALVLAAQSALAQPGYRHPYHHRYYYGYSPVYAPVVVSPPPPTVVVTPAPVIAPAPMVPPPAPVYVAPGPVYMPPTYTYGAVGPRGHAAFGYSSPGFGVYIGR